MHLTKRSNIEENSATKLAWCAENSHDLEAVYNVTPFDELLEKSEREASNPSEREEINIRIEGVRRLLIYLFDGTPNAPEALKKLYVICYTLAPQLLGDFSTLEKIARQFSQTKQAFSKKLINLNKALNIRSRNQKSESAVETYREITTANHAERIADEKAEAKRAYLREWRKRNAAEVRAYQAQYRARFKERLNRKRREERNAKKGSH